MLDMGKEMMEIKAANTKLRHELASLKASGVSTAQGHTSGTVQLHKPARQDSRTSTLFGQRKSGGLAPTTQHLDAVERDQRR